MKIVRIILRLVNWTVIGGITLFAVYILSSNFSIFGKYRSFLVQSGSMEPSIMTGDIIVVGEKDKYVKNDVVTFTNNSGRVVTHRIMEVEPGDKDIFSTKGDANVTGDEDTIASDQVIGKVVLVVPKIGYLMAFAKTGQGLIFLLVIPAIIFILDELVKVNKNASPRY